MKLLFSFLFFTLFVSSSAWAGCGHRLGVGAGIVHIDSTDQTKFEVGAEYECRLNPLVGVGAFGNYIFSDPSITLVGAPEIFVHPFLGDLYVAGSPLAQFISGRDTHYGMRLAARVPLPLGFLILVPSAAVDFINGGRNYWFSLGIQL